MHFFMSCFRVVVCFFVVVVVIVLFHCTSSFVTPLIPTDWTTECDIPTADQVVAKSASQGSESIIRILVLSI